MALVKIIQIAPITPTSPVKFAKLMHVQKSEAGRVTGYLLQYANGEQHSIHASRKQSQHTISKLLWEGMVKAVARAKQKTNESQATTAMCKALEARIAILEATNAEIEHQYSRLMEVLIIERPDLKTKALEILGTNNPKNNAAHSNNIEQSNSITNP